MRVVGIYILGLYRIVNIELYNIYVNKIIYEKNHCLLNVAGGMTKKKLVYTLKSHTGQWVGPGWKTLVFVVVVGFEICVGE